MPSKPLPRTPLLNPRFEAAIDELGAAFRKSSIINHRGTKGSSREKSIRDFLADRLPMQFGVTNGEVVDITGHASPQLDVMIYDQMADFPLNAEDESHILAAEALIASIEIKSRLTKAEIDKSVAAARKLRALKPWGHSLGGRDKGSEPSGERSARYFHALFAFETDLSESDWAAKEAERFGDDCLHEHIIDCVYVLDRGLLSFASASYQVENEDASALVSFYFSLLNFTLREGKRRPPTEYDRYVSGASKGWKRFGRSPLRILREAKAPGPAGRKKKKKPASPRVRTSATKKPQSGKSLARKGTDVQSPTPLTHSRGARTNRTRRAKYVPGPREGPE